MEFPESGASAPVPAPPEPPRDGIAFTLERFEALRQTRFRYLMLYGAAFLFFATPRFLGLAIQFTPNVFIVTDTIAMALLATFFVFFFRVLRAMGYGVFIAVIICALVLFPVPGFIILILFDRSLSRRLERAWETYEARVAERSNAPAE